MLERELVQQAQDFAKSDAVKEILNRLEEHYTVGITHSAPHQTDLREHNYRMILAVNALRAEIGSLADANRIKAWNRRSVAADTTLR